MIIGFLRLELHLPAVHSLKEKRQIVKSLRERVQNKFNVSLAEIGCQDDHQWCELGIVMIACDAAGIDRGLAAAAGFIARNYPLEITAEQLEHL